MNQCPECRTFKKADNGIRCYREMKERYEALVADLERIAQGTAYTRIQQEITQRLQRERHKEQ